MREKLGDLSCKDFKDCKNCPFSKIHYDCFINVTNEDTPFKELKIKTLELLENRVNQLRSIDLNESIDLN